MQGDELCCCVWAVVGWGNGGSVVDSGRAILDQNYVGTV